MIPVTVLHRQSQARMAQRHDEDTARAHVEQCASLPDLARQWWYELDDTELARREAHMLRAYLLRGWLTVDDTKQWVIDYRVRAFLDSDECETLCDDLENDPQKEWPR